MRVLIPNPLRSYTEEAAVVAGRGRTLDELATNLDQHYPGLRFRIIDEQGSIRPHIKFFVNRVQVRELASRVSDDDEVMIVCALSGG